MNAIIKSFWCRLTTGARLFAKLRKQRREIKELYKALDIAASMERDNVREINRLMGIVERQKRVIYQSEPGRN